MTLPTKYQFLAKEPAPKMIIEALKWVGTKEKAGDENNPVIMEWAKELGLKDYTADSIAWCGLFMAKVAKDAGKEVVKNPLWAANWLNFGSPAPSPMLGDILVFKRPGGGHVGLYVGEDTTTYHVLGGNQSDAVGFTRIDKERMRGARRQYTNPPANIRKIILGADGPISNNEA